MPKSLAASGPTPIRDARPLSGGGGVLQSESTTPASRSSICLVSASASCGFEIRSADSRLATCPAVRLCGQVGFDSPVPSPWLFLLMAMPVTLRSNDLLDGRSQREQLLKVIAQLLQRELDTGYKESRR